ncbi:myosin heavy chain IB-like isoform X2 [Corticium candelabrum]|uniref:myosin heavy chain IB-like isoform X2 n=1 Tax=Corticium candelabrum TaxID=121492 RepID=UPI002E25F994|nr:myosin heavy chain IB-like isoform X2 [Corticium candelabrum]
MTRELAKFLGKKERRRSSLGKGDVRDSLGLAKNPKIVSYFARHGDRKVIFSGIVMKVNRKNKMQQRVALVSDNALYNLEPGSLKCKRRIAFNSMSHLSLSTLPDNFFVVHVPAEYDYVLISQDKVELITRLMEAFEEAIESSLRINFENKIEFRIDQSQYREIEFHHAEEGITTQIFSKKKR